MNDFVIFPANSIGCYFYSIIKDHLYDKSFIGFIDNSEYKNELNVISEARFVWERFNGDILIAIEDEFDSSDEIFKLLSKGLKNIYVINPNVKMINEPAICENGGWNEKMVNIYSEFVPSLWFLYTHIADECNLKCRACLHYSNIHVGQVVETDFSEYISDLMRLKEIFNNIYEIHLLGGEPLLNNRIEDYFTITRSIFPNSEIAIVTNGLLIPHMPRRLFDLMNKCDIGFRISLYPPTKQIIEKIINVLNENKVSFLVGEEVHKFTKIMSQGNTDPNVAFSSCKMNKGCYFLRKGSIAPCPMIPLLYENQSYFGFNIPDSEYNNSVFKLYDKLDGWQIGSLLKKSTVLCKYCSSKSGEIDWSNECACRNDWFVD